MLWTRLIGKRFGCFTGVSQRKPTCSGRLLTVYTLKGWNFSTLQAHLETNNFTYDKVSREYGGSERGICALHPLIECRSKAGEVVIDLVRLIPQVRYDRSAIIRASHVRSNVLVIGDFMFNYMYSNGVNSL